MSVLLDDPGFVPGPKELGLLNEAQRRAYTDANRLASAVFNPYYGKEKEETYNAETSPQWRMVYKLLSDIDELALVIQSKSLPSELFVYALFGAYNALRFAELTKRTRGAPILYTLTETDVLQFSLERGSQEPVWLVTK